MFKDRSGEIVGNIKLVSLSDKQSNSGYKYYNCKCLCGNNYTARIDTIDNKSSTRCPDCRHSGIKVNTKVGPYLIIKKMGNIGSGTHIYWWCRCECGRESKKTTNSLQNSKNTNCIHLNRRGSNNPLWNGYKDIDGQRWAKIKYSAFDRNKTFNVTKEQVWGIGEKQNWQCALSGIDISFVSNKYDSIYSTASIDRIDNNIGYELNNIWIIHKDINRIKHTLSLHEFYQYCKDISNPIKNYNINTINDFYSSKFKSIRYGANSRKLVFDISKKELVELFNKQEGRCSITNYSITLPLTLLDFKSCNFNASLDRIDSKVGYIKGNLHWVHKDINLMKQAYSMEYFLEMCLLVTNFNKETNK